MIWLIVVTTVIQFIIYSIIWYVRYDEATTYEYGSYKKNFKEFSNKYKWWYFTIPFYFIFLGVKSLYNLIKNVREKTINLLKEDEPPTGQPERRVATFLDSRPRTYLPPPPNILDRHRGVQRNLDTMLEERGFNGKSIGDILDDMVEEEKKE